jgi:glycosyltransferase involved in cell wall biosynthesis
MTGRVSVRSDRLLRLLETSGLSEDDVVYSALINEDIETMRRLKARGVKIVHECIIGPDVGLWLHEERKLFPGLEDSEDLSSIEAGRERDRKKYELSDLILVPSDFAASSVTALGASSSRIRHVPYGIDTERFASGAATEPGRVLFVGSVGLRKGSHYLAMASRQLARRKTGMQIRVAGPLRHGSLEHSIFEGPTYLGQVPRSEIRNEFAKADVFALPTLCEGSAVAHLEALACGLPVVTTPNCGSVVRDGVEGFIVPVRDPEALAGRIEQIVTDRALRERMSRNARARAAEFSTERYAERLLAALSGLSSEPDGMHDRVSIGLAAS